MRLFTYMSSMCIVGMSGCDVGTRWQTVSAAVDVLCVCVRGDFRCVAIRHWKASMAPWRLSLRSSVPSTSRDQEVTSKTRCKVYVSRVLMQVGLFQDPWPCSGPLGIVVLSKCRGRPGVGRDGLPSCQGAQVAACDGLHALVVALRCCRCGRLFAAVSCCGMLRTWVLRYATWAPGWARVEIEYS